VRYYYNPIIGAFVKRPPVYVRGDVFNKNGITEGDVIQIL